MAAQSLELDKQLYLPCKIKFTDIDPEFIKDHDRNTQQTWSALAIARVQIEHERFDKSIERLTYASIVLNASAAAYVGSKIFSFHESSKQGITTDILDLLVVSEIFFLLGLMLGSVFAILVMLLLQRCYSEYNARIVAYLKNQITDRQFFYVESFWLRNTSGVLAFGSLSSFIFGIAFLVLVMFRL